MAANIIRPKYP